MIRGGNLVKETTNTAGTSIAFSLLGAPAGFRTYSQEYSNGDVVFYYRGDSSGIFECGLGTWSSSTNKITPTIGLDSSSTTPGGAFVPITWGAGTQNVTACPPAQAYMHPQNNGAEYSTYGNLTTLRSNLSVELAFASGTKKVFCQTSAPTGYTIDTSAHDKVLRLVNDATGGSTGGSWTISGVTVQGHVLTTAELANHTHALSYGRLNVAISGLSGLGVAYPLFNDNSGTEDVNVGTAGGDSSHTHGLSADGSWRPAYKNVIVGSKT